MLLLLAQLVSPPIQPGPARIPDVAPNQQPQSPTQPGDETAPTLTLPNEQPLTAEPETSTSPVGGSEADDGNVKIVGDLM